MTFAKPARIKVRRGAALSLAITLIGGGFAYAADGQESSVAIDEYGARGDGYVFEGHVESSKRACENGRTVIVIGYQESQIQSDEKLGKARTSPDGAFRVTLAKPPSTNIAYARVKPERRRDGTVRCRPADSERVPTDS